MKSTEMTDSDEPKMTIKEAIARGHFHLIHAYPRTDLGTQPEMSEEEQQAEVLQSLIDYKPLTTP